jgi:hypothetical protein
MKSSRGDDTVVTVKTKNTSGYGASSVHPNKEGYSGGGSRPPAPSRRPSSRKERHYQQTIDID